MQTGGLLRPTLRLQSNAQRPLNTIAPTQPAKWPRRIAAAAGFILLITLLAVLVAGPGYRAGLLKLLPAFGVLMVGGVAAALALVVGIVGAFMNWRRGTQGMLAVSVISALVGLGLTINNVSWLRKGRAVPAIHDISTDLADPPAFVDVLPLRAGAANPPEYAGAEVAELQREDYADLVPVTVAADADAALLVATLLSHERQRRALSGAPAAAGEQRSGWRLAGRLGRSTKGGPWRTTP